MIERIIGRNETRYGSSKELFLEGTELVRGRPKRKVPAGACAINETSAASMSFSRPKTGE